MFFTADRRNGFFERGRRSAGRQRAGRRMAVSATAMAVVAALLSAVPLGPVAPAAAATPPHGIDYRWVPIRVPSSHGRALGVSDQQIVVGFEIASASQELPFVALEGFDTTLLPLEAGMRNGGATAISPDGHLIVGWEELPTGACTPVEWTGTVSTSWTVTPLAGTGATGNPNLVGCSHTPVAVANDGTVAIATETSGGGLVWRGGAATAIPGQPRAMASSGEIAGFIQSSGAQVPWRSSAGAGPLPTGTNQSEAKAVAANGAMALDSNLGPYERRPDGTDLALDKLPTTGGTAPAARVWAMSDHEEIVGDSDVASSGGAVATGALPHGVRWDADGSVIDLNDVVNHTAGETILTARAVNKAGDIAVGAASDASAGAEIPGLLVALPPVIFVPGVAGSSLVEPTQSGLVNRWLGCGTDHSALALPPDGSTTIYSDEVLAYATCAGIGIGDDLKAYGPFIDSLKAVGMVPYDDLGSPQFRTGKGCITTERDQHPNLFTLPYDWRQPNEVSAQRLADLMDCVRDFYTGPVVLVAHSMGGLVSRRYILDHPKGSSHVRDLVTIGTPWLGAPKLINAEETGDFAPLLMPSTTKKIVPTMPGPGQLIPSTPYYGMAMPPFVDAGRDLNGDGNDGSPVPQPYDQAMVEQLLDANAAPDHAAITVNANAFHDHTTPEGGQDDWTNDRTGVHYTVLYGVRAQKDTIGATNAVTRAACVLSGASGLFSCSVYGSFTVTWASGDKTVPIESSRRVSDDGTVDLNNHDHEDLIPVTPSDAYGDDTLEHTGLTRNPVVQQKVIGIDGRLLPDAQPQRSARTASATADQWDIDVSGLAGTTTVTLPDGSSDAPVGDARPSLTNVSRAVDGAGSEQLVLPANGLTTTVSFTTSNGIAELDARRQQGDTISARAGWLDASVPAGKLATLTLDASGATLRYDADGNGVVDTAVAPTSAPTGAALADTTAPAISASTITVNGTKQLVISADDAGGSGVARLLWSSDGHHFAPVTGPVALDPATSEIQAFADDAAGNRSPVQRIDLTNLAVTPLTTATAIPAVPAGRWSTQPLSVHLSAVASDGRAVSSIRYGFGTATSTAAGSSVTVPIPDGAAPLVYGAVDDQGGTEALHTLAYGVDATAPAVTVSTPSPAPIGALTTVTGTSSDATSGVATVEVSLERNRDGARWDGSAWQAHDVWLPATTKPDGSWSLQATVPTGSDLPAGAYTLHVRATDGAGNVGTASSPITITAATTIRSLDPPYPLDANGYTKLTSSAIRINASGQVAGSANDSNGGRNFAMRWDPDGTSHDLRDSPPLQSTWVTPAALAINDQGVVAGQDSYQAALWRADSSEALLPPAPSGNNPTLWRAQAINGNGVAAGSNGYDWAIWPTTLSRQALAKPSNMYGTAGFNANVYRIDGSGTAYGEVVLYQGCCPSDRETAIIGTTSTATYLFPGATASDMPLPSGIRGLDAAGDLVGWGGTAHAPGSSGTTVNPPFIHHPDGTTTWFDLGAVGDTCGTASAINGIGVIVGYGGQCSDPTQELADPNAARAFVIRGGVVTDLNAALPAGSGWVLQQALDINDANQIVGVGTLNGVQRGFVLALGGSAAPDTAPVASDTTASTAAGQPVAITLQGSDADHDPITWSVVAGPSHGTLGAISGSSVTYTPADGYSGPDSFTVRASDGTLSSGTATVSVTVTAPPAPPPPVAVLTGPSTVVEGTPVTFDASASYAPDGAGPLTFSWDVDGNGTFGDATSPTVTFTPTDDATHPVAVRVTNANGTTLATTTLTVANAAPIVHGPAAATVASGTGYSSGGTFVDPGADSWTATVDYGDGAGPQALPLAGTAYSLDHTYSTVGPHVVTVTVCDDDGGCGTGTAMVGVPAPAVSIAPSLSTLSLTAGVPATMTVGSFTDSDPSADPSQLQATIDWGDGTAPVPGTITPVAGGPYTVTATHTYAAPGGYPTTLTVQAGSLSGAATATTSVALAPLSGEAVPVSATAGQPATVALAGVHDDAPTAGTSLAATVDWHDGTAPAAAAVAAVAPDLYSVTATHTWPAAGSTTATVTVTDGRDRSTVVTTPITVQPAAVTPPPPSSSVLSAYWLTDSAGRVTPFGTAAPLADLPALGVRPAAPIVGIAALPVGDGAWLVGADGGVFALGTAPSLGSVPGLGIRPASPITAMAATPSGHGYWLAAADGGVFAFGDAPFLGSMGGTALVAPIVGIAPTASGHGYRLVAADGGIFDFGDATFAGSMADRRLNAPIVGMATAPTGDGYLLVAADGGVFTFGSAAFHGSASDLALRAPINGILVDATGDGYWLDAKDGGIFSYGDATFFGSGVRPDQPPTFVGAAPATTRQLARVS